MIEIREIGPGELAELHVNGVIKGTASPEVVAEIERLQACERALKLAETALREVVDEDYTLGGVVLDSVRDALTAIATLRTTQE